jgi:hypothetical protein
MGLDDMSDAPARYNIAPSQRVDVVYVPSARTAEIYLRDLGSSTAGINQILEDLVQNPTAEGMNRVHS